MHLLDSFFIHYLHRFDQFCFSVRLHGETYTIGEGTPVFTLVVNKDIPKKGTCVGILILKATYLRR